MTEFLDIEVDSTEWKVSRSSVIASTDLRHTRSRTALDLRTWRLGHAQPARTGLDSTVSVIWERVPADAKATLVCCTTSVQGTHS